ncbi:MAG TPA: glycoside hydrolase family 20 zincin-like fold domain-containing protein, partial [Chitinophagaceae bacterium]|nr:glycoside hydrolase family 20 zincin-like fold domain-containing protein [Chitinophagaceae bacterium]
MKRLVSIFLLVALSANILMAQVHLIPQPVELKSGQGYFTLNPNSGISHPANNPDAKRIAEQLAKQLSTATGFKIPVLSGVMTTGMGNITLNISPTPDPKLGNEGYVLKLTESLASITANTAAGLF